MKWCLKHVASLVYEGNWLVVSKVKCEREIHRLKFVVVNLSLKDPAAYFPVYKHSWYRELPEQEDLMCSSTGEYVIVLFCHADLVWNRHYRSYYEIRLDHESSDRVVSDTCPELFRNMNTLDSVRLGVLKLDQVDCNY